MVDLTFILVAAIVILPIVFVLLLFAAIMKSKIIFFKGNEKPSKAITIGVPIIVAIIFAAIIILALMPRPGPHQYGDPIREVANQIKNFYNRPSDYGQSKEVAFNQQYSTLNAKSIAERAQVGLDATQICISKGDYQDSLDFTFENPTENLVLRYTGTQQKKVKLGIMCDDGATLKQSLEDQGVAASDLKCAGDKEPSGQQTYCAIILVAA